MTISSPGIGSNLDVNGIVSQLMTIERQPVIRLAQKAASFQAKLSAIGSIKGALSSFQSTIRALSDISKFQAVRVTSDATIATATGSSAAVPGTYALEVTKLAQAQKLATAGQISTSAVIGNGTLSFDFGTISSGVLDAGTGKYTGSTFTSSGSGIKTVVIDATNNSLAGIRDAINGAKIGVNATIVNDGDASPNRLVLTDTSTGKASSIKISVAGDAALSTLLAHDPGAAPAGQALSETVTAQNAEFKIDGLSVSKASNTITDVIQGVTLNLAKTNSGSPTSIVIAHDSSSVIGAVGQFVYAYNQINQTLKDASAYNATTKQAAILNGDASVRTLQTQIRAVLNAPVAGGASAYTVLSQVGVTVQKDGTLAVDNTKLQTAMDSNYNDVAGLFAALGKTGDSLMSYAGSSANTKPGAYAVNITQLAGQARTTGSSAVAAGPTKGDATGSAAAGLTIDATNNTLNVTLDGTSATITLGSAVYADANALAAEVQTRINAAFAAQVTVTQTAGALKITSNSSGAASSVSVTGGNGKTNLLGVSPTVTAGSETSITTGVNDTLQVLLDGVTSTVTLAAGRYSYATLATEVQSKINGATAFSGAGAAASVTQAGGIMTLMSNRYGSGGAVSITGGNGLANLVGGAPVVTVGVDVAGTINGIAGAGSGQALTGAIGDASEGFKLLIIGGAIGARGTANYSQGYAYQFDKLIDTQLGINGQIASRTDGINASLKSIQTQTEAMNQRLVGTEARLRAQFTALDLVMSNMTKTSSFLTQQLSALSNLNSK